MAKSKNKEKKSSSNKENEELKTQLARTLADYDNLKRRTEEERLTWIKFSSQTIIVKMLSVLDMLEKAQKHLKDGGLSIAIVEFKKLLEEEGAVEIRPEIGADFDENSMEAIEIVEGESNNKITEVVQTGWKYRDDDKVIRYAKVKVSKNENE